MAEEITRFHGYCVYVKALQKYVLIVGVMNDMEIVDNTVYISFEQDSSQAIVYSNKLFYPIYYDKEEQCLKLRNTCVDSNDVYKVFIDNEKEVSYNTLKLDYCFLTANFEFLKIPDELKELYFIYEINSEAELSFLTYSNPLDISIFKNTNPDLNVVALIPDPKNTLPKISELEIKLTSGTLYKVNAEILNSVIIDHNGNVLSQFESYKETEDSVIVYFQKAATENCLIFIPDNSISISGIQQGGQKGGEIVVPEELVEEDYPIPYFLTGYTYEQEAPPEPEIPETIVINGVVYRRTLTAQPSENYQQVTYTDPVTNVTYYAWVPISRPEIEYYVNPTANSSTDTTFNNLFKYYKNANVVNNGRRRTNDTVFINKNSINILTIKPLIRTGAHYIGESGNRDILFKGGSIKVIVTEDVVDENGVYTQICHNISYNKLYNIALDTIRYIKLKIEFYVDDLYHLEKTVLFFYTPNDLYTRLTNYDTFDLTSYNSLIDILTGEPAIVKYGCLLLTGHDVIESVKTSELDENNQPITKLVAELVPTTKVRMGNLRGIYNETFGTNLPRGYGLYGESVYLTGNFYLNNGKSLVDINNDVTMAVGNINRILTALENLSSNFLNSIYNLTISLQEMATALTASFNLIIGNNNDAIFKLGKDYSVWSLGNAGISIINPNAIYTETGDIDDSTVGDNDEYVLLQGESIQISTTVIENNRLKVIVCNTNPQSFLYPETTGNEQLFFPNNSGIKFAIGWIPTALGNAYLTGTKCLVIPNDSQNAKDYYRYVALEKTLNISDTDGFVPEHPLALKVPNVNEDYNIYSFSISREVNGSEIYKTADGTAKFIELNGDPNNDNIYYVIPDIKVAGLFRDGKFNSDYIETENLIAFLKSSNYRKNPNFDITAPITDEGNNPNFPVLNANNNSLAKDAPFAVISGTTGKITAQGMQMREATIGKESGKHIKITDNTGIKVTPDYFNNNYGTASVPESEPAIYLRDGEDIIAEFSSKTGKLLEKFFKNTSTSIVGSGNSSFNLGTASGSINSAVITYNRNLIVANATTNSNGWLNKTILGQLMGNNGMVNVAFLYHHTTTTTELNPNGNAYWCYNLLDETWNCPGYFAANIDVYIMTTNMYNRFIPTKTSYGYIGASGLNTYVQALINSDIGRVLYTTESPLTFEKVLKTGIELTSNNIYEILGNFMATISLLSELISSLKKEVNSSTDLISNVVDNGGNPINVTGLNNNIAGMFTLTLSFGLYNGETLIKTLKAVTYSESCRKIYINDDNFDFKNYLNENDIYNIDEDSVETSEADVISEIRKNISNGFSNSSIRFSSLIKPNLDYNNLTLKATLKVNLAIDAKMSEYKFTKLRNNDDHLNIIDGYDPDIIRSLNIIYEDSGSGTTTYSEVTPNNDRYYWHPLLSPERYTIKPKVRVTNCSINLIKVKERTTILGNGFLTGYEEDNKFEVSFVEKSDKVLFRKSEFIGGIGEILTNSGIYNAFRLNNKEYTINKMIPILYGTFYPDAGIINIQGTGDYSNVYYPVSRARYHYYNFSGYSLFSADGSELGITNTYRIFTNVFKPITGASNINGFGYLHYDPKYDLYICSGDRNGLIVILFGNNWNNLFSRYGKHIILSLVPKYYLYTYIYSATLPTYTAYKPIVVNNSGIYNSVDLTYKKILSYTKNGRGYTLNFGNKITQSNLFGFEVDCWALDMSINSNNHDILNSVLGYFDIIVNYIPDLS